MIQFMCDTRNGADLKIRKMSIYEEYTEEDKMPDGERWDKGRTVQRDVVLVEDVVKWLADQPQGDLLEKEFLSATEQLQS